MFESDEEERKRKEEERKRKEQNMKQERIWQNYLRDKKLKAKILDMDDERYGKIASNEIKSILIQYGSPELEIDDYIIIQRQNSPKIYLRVTEKKIFHTKIQATKELYSWFNYYMNYVKRDLGMTRKELKREINMIMDGGSMVYIRFSKE